MRILVVDDSAFARRKSRQLLEQLGHQVEEAANGRDAIARCEQSCPDAVMLDLVMEGMSGWEVLERVRAVHPRMPAVIASADTQESTAVHALKGGAVAVLTKPLHLEDVRRAFSLAVRQSGDALTPHQIDAATELVNIGYGRAAAALAAMTRNRVTLEPPELTFCPAHDLPRRLAPALRGEVVCVNQSFAGAVGGSAMLLVETNGAEALQALVQGLVDDGSPLGVPEVMNEIGNVMLSALLGVFGNLLNVQVSFHIPTLTTQNAAAMMQSVVSGNEHVQQTIIVQTRFTLQAGQVSGFMVLLLGVASFEKLVNALDRL